jgi:uncharacterized protein YjbJ (UPF0337 family)
VSRFLIRGSDSWEVISMDDSSRMKMEGKWEQARGRVKEAWGVLSDDDLDRIEGKWDRLVGIVKERTGESTEAVERKLRELVDKL